MSEEIEDLRRQVKALGISRVAKAAGVHINTLQDFASQATYSLRADNAAKVQSGIRKLRKQAEPDELQNLPIAMRGHGGIDLVGEAYTMVPVFDLAASAGAGSLVEDEAPIAYEAFRAGELRRITKAEYENLSIIRVAGDSMSPFLNNGDRVLVDRGITRVKKDGIYIVDIEGELMIKRCQIDIDAGFVWVRSDNPTWPEMKVSKLERLRIVGRAVWMARAI